MNGKQTILHSDPHPELDEAARELLKPLAQLTEASDNTPANDESVWVKMSEYNKLKLHSSILTQIIALTEGK